MANVATTMTREVVDNYFDLLEETVLQNDLGMPLSHRPGRVIAKKG